MEAQLLDDLQFKQILETLKRIADAMERTAAATETLARGAVVEVTTKGAPPE